MRLTSEELKELFRKEIACASRLRAECLSAEEMMRAAEGRMSQAERERVTGHLRACADCAEEYRVVPSLKPWAATAAASIGEPGPEFKGADDAPRSGWRERLAAFLSPAVFSYAIAAALLIVSVALGVWAVSLYREKQRLAAGVNQQLNERDRALAAAAESLAKARQQAEEAAHRSERQEMQIAELRRNVDELSQPQINAPIYDIESKPDRGPGQSEPATVEVLAGTNLFTLILHSSDKRSFSNYAMEAIDGNGKVVWHGQGLRKSENYTFTVILARRLFPSGQYRIKLYGLRGGDRELVEDYVVRVRYR
jgi:hypothetical protein